MFGWEALEFGAVETCFEELSDGFFLVEVHVGLQWVRHFFVEGLESAHNRVPEYAFIFGGGYHA